MVKLRQIALRLVAVLVGLLVSAAIAEITFRILERRQAATTQYEGSGGLWIPDARWGWKPAPGWFRHRTHEFVAEGHVNAAFMNDVPLDPAVDRRRIRVFAVGDSHTFATGVSQRDTWPKQLEAALNRDGTRFRVYNAGTTGYNVHQYLLRVIDQGPVVRPHVVIVAVTFASDFFDLLPPDRGGWIHGGDLERDYFDLDDRGRLVERHWSPAQASQPGAVQPLRSRSIRSAILNLATVRYFRRTPFALALASRLRWGNDSLWPNMDIAMEREVAQEHTYNHALFRAVLQRMKQETDRLQARLVVVGIPYLPQVYDAMQTWAFPGERFDRAASSRRLRAHCAAAGAEYVDTLDAMRSAVAAAGGAWVHFPEDGHPTADGHRIIAETIARTVAFEQIALPAPAGVVR